MGALLRASICSAIFSVSARSFTSSCAVAVSCFADMVDAFRSCFATISFTSVVVRCEFTFGINKGEDFTERKALSLWHIIMRLIHTLKYTYTHKYTHIHTVPAVCASEGTAFSDCCCAMTSLSCARRAFSVSLSAFSFSFIDSIAASLDAASCSLTPPFACSCVYTAWVSECK